MLGVTDAVSPWTAIPQCLERRFRVGACPILSVKAEYPLLLPATDGASDAIETSETGAEAFNSFYREAAERFVNAGIQRFSPELRQVYEELSPEAACCFARRELGCRMLFSAKKNEKGTLYEVTVERYTGYRRGGIETLRPICKHLWRFPEGIVQKQVAVEF